MTSSATHSMRRVGVRQESDVVVCMLEVGRMARDIGFGEQASQMLVTVASELARNLLKYAFRGDLTLRVVSVEGRSGLEIISNDGGPGIGDIEMVMTEHFSSGGSLGLGLPGVRRMMDDFEIESTPGKGTCISARKWV